MRFPATSLIVTFDLLFRTTKVFGGRCLAVTANMSVTTPTYGNSTSTASACTFYGGPSCVVDFKPAFAYWGGAIMVTRNASTTGTVTESTMPPIATTRYYVDPDSNRTVSSSLICNWSLYESEYYNEGTTTTQPDSYPSTQPGYYTVNSQCSLLGVFPGLLDNNGTWHHLTATYPDPLIDLGNTIRITTRLCPSTIHTIVTTSVTYTDEFSSYIETIHPSGASGVETSTGIAFPWWTFPELTNYLSDIPELSSCSISLGGSPAHLRGASYLTENVVLPRTTQASSTQAKQPAPDSSTVARPSAEPEPASSTPASPVSRPDAIATSSTPPVPSPTQPGDSTEPDNDDPASPDDSITDDSATDDPGTDDSSPNDASSPSPSATLTQGNEESTPINQDLIWSAIGEIGQDESNSTTSSYDSNMDDSGGWQGDNDSTSNPTEGTNQSEDDTAVQPIDQSTDDNPSSSGSTDNPGNSQDEDNSTSSGDTIGDTDTDGSQTPGGSPTEVPAGVVVTMTSSGTPVAFTVVLTNDDRDDAVQSFVAANGASVTSNALVVGTQTIEAGGPAVTITNDGQTQVLSVPAQTQDPAVVVTATDSSGQEAVVTLSAGSAADQDAVQSIVAAQGVVVDGSAVIIGSQTLQPGRPAVTVSNDEVTQVLSLPLPTAGSPIVVTATDSNGQAVAVTMSADNQAAVQALVSGYSAQYEDGALVIGTQTLVPGGPAITIAGSEYTGAVSLPASSSDDTISVGIPAEDGKTQEVAIVSNGDLDDSEVQSLLAVNDAHVTDGMVVVGTQTLTRGGSGITLTEGGQTQVISLPEQPRATASGPLTTGSQVVYPGGSPVTITSNDRTQVMSLPTLVPGSSGLVSSVIIANASTTTTEGIGDYICSVMGSCSTAVDASKSRTDAADVTGTSDETSTPTGDARGMALQRVSWMLATVLLVFVAFL
ncbi:hypothetical protein CLAFUR0_07623 [Fulvia fulva]|nr:hypothetical protein CLAFUR0_07623 [Fulvia fulva]